MAETFTYDVFISHSEKDKPAVRELAERLRKDGLRIWLDDWEIKPGDAILLKIQAGLEQSRTLVLVMSRHASASEWVTFEHHSVLFRDPTNQQRRFIPVRLDDAEILDTLKQFAYVDWRSKNDQAYEQLLNSIKPPARQLKKSAKGKRDVSESENKNNQVLEGHLDQINAVVISPDGKTVMSASSDKTIRLWSIETGECIKVFKEHDRKVIGLSMSSDGQLVLTNDTRRTSLINFTTHTIEGSFHWNQALSRGMALLPDKTKAILADWEGGLFIWYRKPKSRDSFYEFGWHDDEVTDVITSNDGKVAVTAGRDGMIRVWDIERKFCRAKLFNHRDAVRGVAITPDGERVVSVSNDSSVIVWDLNTAEVLSALYGHSSAVTGVVITADGKTAVTCSDDKTLRVWDLQSQKCLTVYEGHTAGINCLSITPDGKKVVSGSSDKTLRIWDLSGFSELTTKYTNAKVLLVGDSGVGKSGLALRLTEDRFEPTISTDGAEVTRVTDEWATQLKLPHDASTRDIEREIWLWDFAGQADYRLIHQLFMDETALAVLVFNPQAENPFDGLGQWDRDLQRAARRPFKKLLVAGRCDRGALMVSRESVEGFHAERGFADYLETSAQTGAGCNELREAIISNIPWAEIPWTASPHIFRLLKEEIVTLKDEGKVLLRMGELKQQLEMRLLQQALQESAGQNNPAPAIPENFKLEELRAVVGLLVGPGAVWQLEFGDFVLLQPERINSYAAAVMRKVRAHPDEIGSILEEDVLAGKLDYQDMRRLPRDEEQIVLRAMHQTLVGRGLCLREQTERGPLLIFPSYFKRERPELGDHPAPLVTYRFSGMLDEIYATLVVRLHYTTAFEKDQLWRFAADFKTQAGQRVGLKMTRKAEGAGEITVYCVPGVAVETQVNFIRYVHDHLKAKDPEVQHTRHYVCGHCGTPVTNHETVRKKLIQGRKEIICVDCEKQVPLWDLIEEKFASEETQAIVRAMEEQARRAIDNESRELILLGHAFAIAGEAGQIFRPTPNSDWGIDGEIEFKNDKGEASGRRVYLQLKSGDSYLEARKDGREVFKIPKSRHVEYWTAHEYPVMLVIRTSDGQIRWMNVTEYLNKQGKAVKQIVFDGEPFTAASLWRMRDKVLS